MSSQSAHIGLKGIGRSLPQLSDTCTCRKPEFKSRNIHIGCCCVEDGAVPGSNAYISGRFNTGKGNISFRHISDIAGAGNGSRTINHSDDSVNCLKLNTGSPGRGNTAGLALEYAVFRYQRNIPSTEHDTGIYIDIGSRPFGIKQKISISCNIDSRPRIEDGYRSTFSDHNTRAAIPRAPNQDPMNLYTPAGGEFCDSNISCHSAGLYIKGCDQDIQVIIDTTHANTECLDFQHTGCHICSFALQIIGDNTGFSDHGYGTDST